VVRRRAWVIVAAGILGGALAGGYSTVQHKVYEASADVIIQRQASDQVFANGTPCSTPSATSRPRCGS
jgi:uncharacterized protein involved in exopolysaccharide biosynthesis